MLIPEENRKDLTDIPSDIVDKLEVIPVRWIDEVLEVALTQMPTPIKEGFPDDSGDGAGRVDKDEESSDEILHH